MTLARMVHVKKEPYDVHCGRPSIWGNPWSHIEDSLALYIVDTPEEAVACYREWLPKQSILMRKLQQLRGKALGCHCGDGKPCHVRDVIVPMVNALRE